MTTNPLDVTAVQEVVKEEPQLALSFRLDRWGSWSIAGISYCPCDMGNKCLQPSAINFE